MREFQLALPKFNSTSSGQCVNNLDGRERMWKHSQCAESCIWREGRVYIRVGELCLFIHLNYHSSLLCATHNPIDVEKAHIVCSKVPEKGICQFRIPQKFSSCHLKDSLENCHIAFSSTLPAPPFTALAINTDVTWKRATVVCVWQALTCALKGGC